jgi:hypothetical protein
MIHIDWRTIPLPSVRNIPGPLRIAPGETWCANCGAVMHMGGRNEAFARDELLGACCRRPTPVPAAGVLKPWEFSQ